MVKRKAEREWKAEREAEKRKVEKREETKVEMKNRRFQLMCISFMREVLTCGWCWVLGGFFGNDFYMGTTPMFMPF